MRAEIASLQQLAEQLQDSAGQTDPHDRICVTLPRGPHTSCEDRVSPATIRIADGYREEHFHTPAAAERAIREWVAQFAGGVR